MRVTFGVDVGKMSDPAAIVVSELAWRPTPPSVWVEGMDRYEDHHLVRHIERVPLGTSYPELAELIAKRANQVQNLVRAANMRNKAGWLVQEEYAEMKLYVDATGVGQPVVDILQTSGVACTGVYFRQGEWRVEKLDVRGKPVRVVSLGKAYMVSRLQVLLSTGRIHLPDNEEARALARELKDYEIRVNDRANEQMGAFRIGAHDDLVVALGLSTQDVPPVMAAAASTEGAQTMQVPIWAGGTDRAELARHQQSLRSQLPDRYFTSQLWNLAKDE